MAETFLDKIVAATRIKVEQAKAVGNLEPLKRRAEKVRGSTTAGRFYAALSNTERTNIIAEIKRASPSKGVINANIKVDRVARSYESGGAAAISVLTESDHFAGNIADLVVAAKSVDIPVLRKDFIVDEYQIFEAAAAGADAVLLIVAALNETELTKMTRLVDEMGMDALVEVHTSEEIAVAQAIGARIIGINNRNLQTLEVSLDVSRTLIAALPDNALVIAESGISTKDEIDELKVLGFNGFLIGETLMRTPDPSGSLGGLI